MLEKCWSENDTENWIQNYGKTTKVMGGAQMEQLEKVVTRNTTNPQKKNVKVSKRKFVKVYGDSVLIIVSPCNLDITWPCSAEKENLQTHHPHPIRRIA